MTGCGSRAPGRGQSLVALSAQGLLRWFVKHRFDLSLFAGLVGLAGWWYAPVWRAPLLLLPVRTHASATVPCLNAWTIWWNADRLLHGLADYWNAPIFYPEKGAFAFSEPQPLTILLAPLVWAYGTPLAAYHVYVVASLVLNGFVAAILCRQIGLGRSAQALAALAMFFHPLVHRDLDVLQWIPVWPMLSVLVALIRLRNNPCLKHALLVAGAVLVMFYVCVHQAVLVVIVLGLAVPFYIPWRKWFAIVRVAMVATAIVAVGLVPLIWPMYAIARQHRLTRQMETVRAGSASLRDWCRVDEGMWLPAKIGHGHHGGPCSPEATARPMLPGLFRLMLVPVALVAVAVMPEKRWLIWWVCAIVCLSAGLSLGPNLQLGGFNLWQWFRHVPGLGLVRSPYRFGFLAQGALVILAVIGWNFLALWCRHKMQGHARLFWRLLLSGLVVTSALFAALEMIASQPRFVVVPDPRHPPAWVKFLKLETEGMPQKPAVAGLPFGAGATLHDFEPAGRWMMYQTAHGLPLVNGYSGFFPDSWYALARTVNREPFQEESLELLSKHHVRYIVIDERRFPLDTPIPSQAGKFRLQDVFNAEDFRVIYLTTD